VRVDVIGGVVGIRGPPRVELLADRHVYGRPPEAHRPLTEAHDAPVGIGVGNLEIDTASVPVGVALDLTDQLHVDPRRDFPRPLEPEDPFLEVQPVVGWSGFEVRVALEDRLALEPEGRQAWLPAWGRRASILGE